MPKTVLITGSSSGFGKDAALLFAAKGWNVAASMRTPAKANDWTRPAGLFALALDVTERDSIAAAVAATLAKFGRIDVLINNAGFALMGPLEGTPAEDIKRQYDTNVLGLIAMTQAVLPGMRAAGGGVIVNLSSIGGRLTFPLLSAYHSTKFAVEGLTESLQYELALHNIRVKLVEPGGSNTNFGGGSMTRTTHPAYAALTDGIAAMFADMTTRMPGPEKVADAIYHAATDGTRRLRYPVIAAPALPVRLLIGERAWRLIMGFAVRRAVRIGARDKSR